MRTQQSKRATVYLDPDLHKALKIKSAQSEKTLSELVNTAVWPSLAEDHEDLLAFDERKNEPNYNQSIRSNISTLVDSCSNVP